MRFFTSHCWFSRAPNEAGFTIGLRVRHFRGTGFPARASSYTGRKACATNTRTNRINRTAYQRRVRITSSPIPSRS
ncbi:hypothetical protein FTUN_3028 [Frigoriglobus tundricola]|uniref:Uncharacterized protein n=1 Tax=Frigoriglobus tundricola TaxID=2774151 RepID=A0A6M5YMY7_9BACT|nr:hypothetical protein FTUN_3028 [Frigoriglobus tundricola]